MAELPGVGAGVGEAKREAATKSRRLVQVDPGKLTQAILPMSSAPRDLSALISDGLQLITCPAQNLTCLLR